MACTTCCATPCCTTWTKCVYVTITKCMPNRNADRRHAAIVTKWTQAKRRRNKERELKKIANIMFSLNKTKSIFSDCKEASVRWPGTSFSTFSFWYKNNIRSIDTFFRFQNIRWAHKLWVSILYATTDDFHLSFSVNLHV